MTFSVGIGIVRIKDDNNTIASKEEESDGIS